ncbi:RusA family crossover junction endodeoxyribonuclease [bacterium]|nr:RusA family crossover junction endodeoxyribonuclease [bacterium]
MKKRSWEEENTLNFQLIGRPVTKGSYRAYVAKPGVCRACKYGRNLRAYVTNDNPQTKQAESLITNAFYRRFIRQELWKGAVEVSITFYFIRPKSFDPTMFYPIKKSDIDKLQRTVYDALTGVLYVDDGQIVNAHIFKRFGKVEGIVVQTKNLTEIEKGQPLAI